jgi:ribosome-associated translation inhibitor RaiA
MESPIQITFRNVDSSLMLEEHIRGKVVGLDPCFERIMSCRVVLEAHHRAPHYEERLFRVLLELVIPAGKIVISCEPQQTHENIDVAIEDAFDIARRQLQAHARLRAAS